MKVVVTRKDHYCDAHGCHEVIKKGEKAKTYLDKIGRVDGSGSYFRTSYYHLKCNPSDEDLAGGMR